MAQPPKYYLCLTDGDSAHTPSAEERKHDYKTADDYGLTQKALSNFANEIMKKLGREAAKGESDKHSFFVKLPTITEDAGCIQDSHRSFSLEAILCSLNMQPRALFAGLGSKTRTWAN